MIIDKEAVMKDIKDGEYDWLFERIMKPDTAKDDWNYVDFDVFKFTGNNSKNVITDTLQGFVTTHEPTKAAIATSESIDDLKILAIRAISPEFKNLVLSHFIFGIKHDYKTPNGYHAHSFDGFYTRFQSLPNSQNEFVFYKYNKRDIIFWSATMNRLEMRLYFNWYTKLEWRNL